MKKAMVAVLVLLMVSGTTAPCRGRHLEKQRLVGTWTVTIDGVQQIVRVRPDLTMDYGVEELSGAIKLTGARTLEWETRGRLTDRKLVLRLVRGCGGQVQMIVEAASTRGGPGPANGDAITWQPL